MKRVRLAAFFHPLGIFGLMLLSVHAAAPVRLDDSVAGQKLARELQAAVPVENAEFSGVLRLSAPGQPSREVPIKSTVTVNGTTWVSTYVATPKDGPEERLIIRHTAGQPTEYEWHRGIVMTKPTGTLATNSFAGSDFSLLDLGLEFFHWPTQVLAFKEMRKGRGCDVLESRPAEPTLYSRVLSWIDQDTRGQAQAGLLMAEGYDRRGNLLKEFEIKKITRDGQLREIEIRNRQRKTSTRLQFDSGQN